MTISRIELQGQIGRTQDYSGLKHAEDTRGAVEQSQITARSDQAAELKLHHVNDAENARNMQKKFDAKEKGSNEYQGDGGQSKNKNKKESDGVVVIKGAKPQGFDLKI